LFPFFHALSTTRLRKQVIRWCPHCGSYRRSLYPFLFSLGIMLGVPNWTTLDQADSAASVDQNVVFVRCIHPKAVALMVANPINLNISTGKPHGLSVGKCNGPRHAIYLSDMTCFFKGTPCLLDQKLLISRAVKGATGVVDRLMFRHERVWDFFIAAAFSDDPDLWEAHVTDPRSAAHTFVSRKPGTRKAQRRCATN
jgi:hypothetical protein